MMKTKRPVYTDEELLERVLDIESCRNIINRRCYMIANESRRQELNELWVTDPAYRKTASFGKNWGYYVGMDEISNYYVVQHHNARKNQLAAVSQLYPEIANTQDDLNVGCSCLHPVSTPRVILAGDGKTAQGLWYSIGLETHLKENGEPDARWIFERIGADFVKQPDGTWRIWHLLQISDFSMEAGTDLSEDQPRVYPPGEDPLEIEFGEPTISMLTHDSSYNWADNYPPMPKAYFTYSDERSYGPLGHPKYQEGREINA